MSEFIDYSKILNDFEKLLTENRKIYSLLEEIKTDETKIVELAKYPRDIVVEIAINNRMFDSLLVINKPITIEGVTKIYIDVFSTNAFLREFDNYRTGDNSVFSKEFVNKMLNVNLAEISKMKIKDTYARQIPSTSNGISKAIDLAVYCEPACLLPCFCLYAKNIITTCNDTECVIDDEGKGNSCTIMLRYDLLDDDNKMQANKLIDDGAAYMSSDPSHTKELVIKVPCNGEDYVGTVSSRLVDIVRKFKCQDYTAGKYSIEDFVNIGWLRYVNREAYNKYINKEDRSFDDIISFVHETNFVYDKQDGVIWSSSEAYNRHLVYLKSKKNNSPQSL